MKPNKEILRESDSQDEGDPYSKKQAHFLIAVFDTNEQNRKVLGEWLLRYTIHLKTDWDRLWFTDLEAREKVDRYAKEIAMAFISLDDEQGEEIGFRLYKMNPDCLICYFGREERELRVLLPSRPFYYFIWHEGEAKFDFILERMVLHQINSRRIICLESKKMTYCMPLENIRYFQSNLKYVEVAVECGERRRVCTKLSDIEEALNRQHAQTYFVRTHKSYIVNRRHIRALDRQTHTLCLSNGEIIPISDYYYQQLYRSITCASNPQKQDAISAMKT